MWRERVMKKMNWLIYATQGDPALSHAVRELENRGISVTDSPGERVTHLLLPVPCRLSGAALMDILYQLPKKVTVLGGFLDRPELAGHRCIDLLKDPRYLAKNAMITAYCALELAQSQLSVTWEDCPVLILGWGRIGKCLGSLLKALGAQVSIAARKEADLAMIAALGCDGRDIGSLDYILRRYRVIFNTVPSPILSKAQAGLCREDCILVELASSPGMEAPNIIDGRGLPGKLAPESAGKLIARTIMGLWAREEEPM